MSAEENKEFIRRYISAISGKPKPESVLRLFIAEQPLIDHIQTAEAAFPLYDGDVEEIVADGDLVSVRATIRGVHEGPFMGVPPTGKPINVLMYITYRVQGGKIVDHWMLIDNMTMMQQLGLVPVAS